MSLRRYSPMRSMLVDFDRAFRGLNNDAYFKMPIDVSESNDEFIISAELPGFDREDIDIEVNRDEISIKAEKTEVKEINEEENVEETESTETTENEDSVKVIFSERTTRKFARKLSFGRDIVPEEANSKLENGILTITLPKSEKEKPVKLIPETN